MALSTASVRPPLAVALSRDRLQGARRSRRGAKLVLHLPSEGAKLALRARGAKHQDLCLAFVLVDVAGQVGTPASRQLIAPAALGATEKRFRSSHPSV
jgi:hypothetical protein